MRLILFICILIIVLPVQAMEPRTEHTYQLSEGETAPKVSLNDIAWLAGSWSGQAFGNKFEEVWNPPAAGSMVGLFKLMNEDSVEFYELMTITSENSRLSLKVKHFSADFVAWEDKPDYVNFKLVGIDDNAVHFSGMSFYRLGDNKMEGYIVMRSGDQLHEEKLVYERIQIK